VAAISSVFIVGSKTVSRSFPKVCAPLQRKNHEPCAEPALSEVEWATPCPVTLWLCRIYEID